MYVLSCITTSNLQMLTNIILISNYDQDKLTVETLKTHVAYLIAYADLPFAIVEHPAFHNLLRLCNPSTEGMQFKRHAISAQMHKMFEQTQEYIAEVELKWADYVSITTNDWTSPNNKAFMAITVHLITEYFVLRNYCIGLPQIQGMLVVISYIIS